MLPGLFLHLTCKGISNLRMLTVHYRFVTWLNSPVASPVASHYVHLQQFYVAFIEAKIQVLPDFKLIISPGTFLFLYKKKLLSYKILPAVR